MSGIRKYFHSLLLSMLFVGLRSTVHGAAKENKIEGFTATSLWPIN
jgi:hypothetical protein